MKKIIFVRHGRAEEQGYEFSDYQRSLTGKGKTICKLMAGKMKEKDKAPGLFITSPAFRALETALIFAEELNVEPEKIVLDSNLYYHMDMKYLKKLVSGFDEKISTTVLFGHNPSFTHVAGELCKEGIDFMPKTSVVAVSFKTDRWNDIEEGKGKLEYFLRPEILL